MTDSNMVVHKQTEDGLEGYLTRVYSSHHADRWMARVWFQGFSEVELGNYTSADFFTPKPDPSEPDFKLTLRDSQGNWSNQPLTGDAARIKLEQFKEDTWNKAVEKARANIAKLREILTPATAAAAAATP